MNEKRCEICDTWEDAYIIDDNDGICNDCAGVVGESLQTDDFDIDWDE